MPRFSETGHDMALCQICGRDVDTGKEKVEWREDITGSERAGNVCQFCVNDHTRTKLVGDGLRSIVRHKRREPPLSLHEHCRRESGGLEGDALRRYIHRYYGHG